MSNSPRFGLPYLQPSQAQKHVTVNESFALIDALSNLSLKSVTTLTPPPSPEDGDTYFVPTDATAEWSEQSGKAAIFSNGGWVYRSVLVGISAWIEDEGIRATYISGNWKAEGKISTISGAETVQRIIEFDHSIQAGTANTTTVSIPSHSVVFGVSGRLLTGFDSGTLANWDLGVSGSTNRYGSGYGLFQNSYVKALTGHPQVYYQDTPLVLTANGGDFATGSIQFAIHCMELIPPASI